MMNTDKIKVRTNRVVFAGKSAFALTYHNLQKINTGTTGMIVESYIDTQLKIVVYVIRFSVGDEHLFAYMSENSFEQIED